MPGKGSEGLDSPVVFIVINIKSASGSKTNPPYVCAGHM